MPFDFNSPKLLKLRRQTQLKCNKCGVTREHYGKCECWSCHTILNGNLLPFIKNLNFKKK